MLIERVLRRIEIESASPEETEAVAARLAEVLRLGDVVTVSGELGSGKTTLVQAICRGLGARALATSPTYALVHHYEARAAPVYHVDCYRLKSPDEARDLGFDDMTRERAIVLIEWPERAGPWAPPLDRHFRLSHGDEPEIRELEEIR